LGPDKPIGLCALFVHQLEQNSCEVKRVTYFDSKKLFAKQRIVVSFHGRCAQHNLTHDTSFGHIKVLVSELVEYFLVAEFLVKLHFREDNFGEEINWKLAGNHADCKLVFLELLFENLLGGDHTVEVVELV
jgi:hypothetical protein